MDEPRFWQQPAFRFMLLGAGAVLVTLVLAVSGYTMAESPQFCGSCHSMNLSYRTWQASNHKQFICTECHLPNRQLTKKLLAKTQNGLRDIYHETLRDYPAALYLAPAGRAVLVDNCQRCHQSVIENTAMAAGGQDCTQCHRTVVHGRNRSEGGVRLE